MPKVASLPKEIKRKEAGGSGGMENAEAPAKKKKSNQSLDATGSSSSGPPATPAASGGASCSFPMSRVWRLVRGECGARGGAAAEIRTTADAVFIINKASELFLERLTEDAHALAKMERKKHLSYNHISSTVNRGKRYEFLSDFAPEKIRAEDALKLRSSLEA
ncbi:uncharacterized protein LOC110037517 [Phalaenopsis equestris]|uniref:uncharacterized protein LOC110032905 n=1 Tax=Phalaenopsis equestris TaxID=78828 RepID=UPI0009E570B4|nr:uncharacterized protein LOC110032905 [Phalaenopsis equestris]XP_020592349.1 uncharacterized protein LOC110032905 [Phalaenopsis equestris]XP_020597843.1 uncharacterized protein LOC110037517 [Phalaenopsis equestris]